MKKILNLLFEYNSLSAEEAKEVMIKIGKGDFTDAEVAAFISVYGNGFAC
jgi:anthranilate phosphoribosyltransferase